jgi:hypothetical protein
VTRNWKPPGRLDRSRPREVRLTGAGFALLALSVACVAAAAAASAVLLNAAGRDAEEYRLLFEEGADAEAIVTRLWRGSGESRRPFAAYSFSVGGRVYSGESRARLRIWEDLRVGSVLPVRFAVADPSLNVPRGWPRNRTPMWLGPAAGLGLAIVGVLVAFPVRSQRRLLAEGRVSRGIVTKHSRTDKGTSVEFKFLLLNGAAVNGHSRGSKTPTPPGSPVCVLYDPENPRRNALYPLTLARLA